MEVGAEAGDEEGVLEPGELGAEPRGVGGFGCAEGVLECVADGARGDALGVNRAGHLVGDGRGCDHGPKRSGVG